ncbi:hypothetical protein CHARACLAT_003026 [Characodon lateralis]|uniref:Uncharacterized protein n=1 Tax=Characodon lateralis TaxID=208331 RepID=A0ABU7DMV1_9TELE|nr:hypothetical protein [Characodon lateralis]
MNRKELMDRTSSLEQRVAQMEERVGNTEDGMARMEQGATFLFRETTKLAEKCNDSELRMRRKNIQIHGIPEGVEKNDTISFITQFIKSKIQIQYTTEVQKKRKLVRDIIKQLRERNVKARSPYPAKLQVFLDTRTKTFTTMEEAAPMLKEMGINLKDRLEKIHQMVAQTTSVTEHRGKWRQPEMTEVDLRVLLK